MSDENKKGLEDYDIEPELPKLSEQQNSFVKLIMQGYLPTDAYIEAYDCNGKRATAYVEASRLLKNPKITPWIEYANKVKQEHLKKNIQYTIDDAFNEFEEMKIIALESKDQYGRPNVQAANKAIEMKCKLKGLMKDDAAISNQIVMQMSDVEINGETLKLAIGDDIEVDNNESD